MLVLLVGVALWSLAHLFPAAMPGMRARLAAKLGENAFRGLFSLVILGALIVIVAGWRSTPAQVLYEPPLSAGITSSALLLISLVLFFASQIPGHIRRSVRHPQLTATIIWAVTHLLTNGSVRAVLLFGGFAVWAVAEILLINRRDGSWQKPRDATMRADVMNVVLGLIVFGAVTYFHRALFGVPAIGADF